jgi:hypothetical protein
MLNSPAPFFRPMHYGVRATRDFSETQEQADAEYARSMAEQALAKCKPCCGAFIRYERGAFWIRIDCGDGDEVPLAIKFCPSCGKPPERA